MLKEGVSWETKYGYICFWVTEAINKQLHGVEINDRDSIMLEKGMKIIDMVLNGKRINETLRLTKDAVDATTAYAKAIKVYQNMDISNKPNISDFLKMAKEVLNKVRQGEINDRKEELRPVKDFFENLKNEILKSTAGNIEFKKISL